MQRKEYPYDVCEYLIVCSMPGHIQEYMVLAVNCDWALTLVELKADWYMVSVQKMSEIVAHAQFGCRDITGLTADDYLHYHAVPV